MEIAADRCVLRPVTEADIPAIARACAEREIAHWLPHLPQPYGIEDARSFVAQAIEWRALGREFSLAIIDADDGATLLGMVGVHLTVDPPTVGYWVAAEARGRGIATAATRAITAWAFETFDPACIALHAEAANLASCRVAEKAGFVRIPGTVWGAADRELAVFEVRRDRPEQPR
jgi:RimJ/RimL family protein N-acetyltransferase